MKSSEDSFLPLELVYKYKEMLTKNVQLIKDVLKDKAVVYNT